MRCVTETMDVGRSACFRSVTTCEASGVLCLPDGSPITRDRVIKGIRNPVARRPTARPRTRRASWRYLENSVCSGIANERSE